MEVIRCACEICGAAASEDCVPGCYDVVGEYMRGEFRAWLVEWGESLQAIAAKQRRAEVAGLVEDVMDCANDMVGAAESYSPFVLRSATANMRVALDRLARLAGGGA